MSSIDIYAQCDASNTTFTPTRLYIKRHLITGMRYFGKHTGNNIEKYDGSGVYWMRHINHHDRKHIITEWVSDWFYKADEIKEFALSFSELFDIVNSNNWANLIPEDGLNGRFSETAILKSQESRKILFADPVWVKEFSEKVSTGVSLTMNSSEWKQNVLPLREESRLSTRAADGWWDNIGKPSYDKASKTKSTQEWKETTGKLGYEKAKKTRRDPNWQETIGAERNRKAGESIIKTKSDINWKNTVGKRSTEKRIKTQSDPAWIAANSVTCDHCGKTMLKAGYSHWHGDKCKLKD